MVLNQKLTIELTNEQSSEFLETLRFLRAFVESYQPTNNSSKRYLNVKEASEYTGIPVNTLYQYTSNRKAPFIKTGKLLIFDTQELDNWLVKFKKEVING